MWTYAEYTDSPHAMQPFFTGNVRGVFPRKSLMNQGVEET